MNCQFCSPTTGGTHQPHCPNNQSISKSSIEQLFEEWKGVASEPKASPQQIIIGEYIELLSAYAMTIDAIEIAGEQMGEDRMAQVAKFIEGALDKKIDEIVALEEMRDND